MDGEEDGSEEGTTNHFSAAQPPHANDISFFDSEEDDDTDMGILENDAHYLHDILFGTAVGVTSSV